VSDSGGRRGGHETLQHVGHVFVTVGAWEVSLSALAKKRRLNKHLIVAPASLEMAQILSVPQFMIFFITKTVKWLKNIFHGTPVKISKWKQAILMRRSTVLSLPAQLVFPAQTLP
jgi:hypothetical protein